jgi:hypothetical protein
MKRLWPAALVVGIVVFAAGLWTTAPGSSQGLVEKPAPLGLVGLSEGQTLRVSVANVVGFDPQPDPPGCLLRAGFVDGEGNAIGNPGIFELRPGTSRSFDLPASRLGAEERVSVRPVVSDLRPRGNCPAVVTTEVLGRGGVADGIIIHYTPVSLQPWK